MDEPVEIEEPVALYRRRRTLKLFGVRLGPRRQVLYSSLTVLFSIFVNFVFLWPVSHFWALVLIWVSVSSVMFSDMERRPAAIGSGCVFLAGALALAVAGPAPRSLPLSHTWIVPMDAPTPANICDGRTRGADTMLMLVGDSGVLVPPGRSTPVLSVGGCKSVALYQSGGGIGVGVDDYNDYGSLRFRIINNQLQLVQGRAAFQDRAPDHGSVAIRGDDNEELVRITYLNPHTLRVRGVFACKDHAAVRIEDARPIEGMKGPVCLEGRAIDVP